MKHILFVYLIIVSVLVVSCSNEVVGPSDINLQNLNAGLRVDQQPTPIHQVTPAYPDSARRNRIEGIVWTRALVGSDGHVKDAALISMKGGTAEMQHAAIDAVKQWTFTPAMSDGKPVDYWVTIPFRFAINMHKADG